MDRAATYKSYFLQLPQALISQYPELPLEDHTYLRIAMDNAIGCQWELRVPKPAYKHLTTQQRKQVIANLMNYVHSKHTLLEHRAISMAYRGAFD
tara:strand:- start:941 stop:1225 length:285 start_codon:yes stop_codon:yes gene_type:complete